MLSFDWFNLRNKRSVCEILLFISLFNIVKTFKYLLRNSSKYFYFPYFFNKTIGKIHRLTNRQIITSHYVLKICHNWRFTFAYCTYVVPSYISLWLISIKVKSIHIFRLGRIICWLNNVVIEQKIHCKYFQILFKFVLNSYLFGFRLLLREILVQGKFTSDNVSINEI